MAGPEPDTKTEAEAVFAAPRRPRFGQGIPLRAFILGIPLIALNGWWTMALWGRGGYATGQSFPSIVSLYYNVLFSLLLVLGLNSLLRRHSPCLPERLARSPLSLSSPDWTFRVCSSPPAVCTVVKTLPAV